MTKLDETHDPRVASFVAAANDGTTDFPLQNLPFGVFRRRGSTEAFRGGIAIGDQVLDLGALAASGLVQGPSRDALRACTASSLNPFMAMGSAAWSALRHTAWQLLRNESAHRAEVEACLVPQAQVEHALPATIGDYTDFYAIYTELQQVFLDQAPIVGLCFRAQGYAMSKQVTGFHNLPGALTFYSGTTLEETTTG